MYLPHLLFFAVLLINTGWSLAFFAPIIPRTWVQWAVDAGLLCIYVALGFSLGIPLAFALFATCLFILASEKYFFALQSDAYPKTLHKKIKIDLLGVALCSAVLLGTLWGYGTISAWILAIVFAAANMYLLLINPMYKIID